MGNHLNMRGGSAKRVEVMAAFVTAVVILIWVFVFLPPRRARAVIEDLQRLGARNFLYINMGVESSFARHRADTPNAPPDYAQCWEEYLRGWTSAGSPEVRRYRCSTQGDLFHCRAELTDEFNRELCVAVSPDRASFLTVGLVCTESRGAKQVRLLAHASSEEGLLYVADIRDESQLPEIFWRTVQAYDWSGTFTPDPETWTHTYRADPRTSWLRGLRSRSE